MRARTPPAPIPLALFTLALAAASLACATAGGPPAPAAPAHPDVASELAVADCADCHRGGTPAVVAAWEGSRHGLALVKCLVCHGSTGADFTTSPPPARCQGCHAAQVASAAPAKGAPASCFSCHDPHSLGAREGVKSPHAG